jgi:hypothetical protein
MAQQMNGAPIPTFEEVLKAVNEKSQSRKGLTWDKFILI